MPGSGVIPSTCPAFWVSPGSNPVLGHCVEQIALVGTVTWGSWIQRDPNGFHSHGGTPLVGLVHGKSQTNMDDDWRYHHFRKLPNASFLAGFKTKYFKNKPRMMPKMAKIGKVYFFPATWVPLLLFTPSEILAESCRDLLLSKC